MPTYREARREQIRSAECEAAGYPIWSGLVESATKLVVEARLKGAGRHWAPDHVNPLVALRAIACSNRWDETWPGIHTGLRRVARDRPCQWRAERHAAEARRKRDAASVAVPPPTRELPSGSAGKRVPGTGELTAPGVRRPAPDHPWRQPLRPGKQHSYAPSVVRAQA